MRRAESEMTDVVVIGGGGAGDFAAIKAAEAGCSVAQLEKGSVRTAGQTGFLLGMDQLPYVRPPDGIPLKKPVPNLPTADELGEHMAKARASGIITSNWPIIHRESWGAFLELEKAGVKMREDDGSIWLEYLPEEHFTNVMMRGALKGSELMYKLSNSVRKKGVKIFNRVMAIDLLTDGRRVAGVVALDTRSGEIKIFQAKAIILATGGLHRHYEGSSGPTMCENGSACCDGSSVALAYRAGAQVMNMEFNTIDLVGKGSRLPVNGMATFVMWAPDSPRPILRNGKGEEIYPGGKKQTEAGFGFTSLITRETEKGNGPFYWDCTHLPESQIQALERCIENEGPISLRFMKDLGIDMRKDLIEIQYNYGLPCGCARTTENTQTTLEGLYAAGDASGSRSLTAALVFGARAGRNAAKYASGNSHASVNDQQVKNIEEIIAAPLEVKNGYTSWEVESAVRGTMTRYSGFRKSESTLNRALDIVNRLNEKLVPRVNARNPHELMRAMELRNIMLTVEMHLRAALERKETRLGSRACIFRTDYPETDPALGEPFIIWKENGRMRIALSSQVGG